MKRLLCLLLCLLLLPAVFLRAADAEELDTSEREPQAIEIQVYGRARFVSELPEFPVDADGDASGTLPDGTDIIATGAPTGAVLLVVRQIEQTETEPYAWFRSVLGNEKSAMQAYEIYYLDADRNRIPADGVMIKIETPSGMKDISVHSVTPAGSHEKLAANIKDGKAIFRTDGSHYYVLYGNKTSGGSDGPPKTSDDTDQGRWLTLAGLSLAAIILCLLLMKRRDEEEEREEKKP